MQSKALLAATGFSSSVASTIPKTFFLTGQNYKPNVNGHNYTNHIPIPIAVFLPPPLPLIPKPLHHEHIRLNMLQLIQ